MRFLGLVVLQNRLKPETPKVIATLRDARIRSAMVTGDNVYTACSVARECGLVSQQVCTWSMADSQITGSLQPEQAHQLVPCQLHLQFWDGHFLHRCRHQPVQQLLHQTWDPLQILTQMETSPFR